MTAATAQESSVAQSLDNSTSCIWYVDEWDQGKTRVCIRWPVPSSTCKIPNNTCELYVHGLYFQMVILIVAFLSYAEFIAANKVTFLPRFVHLTLSWGYGKDYHIRNILVYRPFLPHTRIFVHLSLNEATMQYNAKGYTRYSSSRRGDCPIPSSITIDTMDLPPAKIGLVIGTKGRALAAIR